MPELKAFKDNPEEGRLFHIRIFTAFAIILLLTAGLVVRLVYLQVVGHQMYATKAKENSIKIEPTVAPRGIIYDRRGNVLADNIQTYSLEIIPEQVKDLNDTLTRLRQIISIPDEKIEQFHKLRIRQKKYTSIPILSNITAEELTRFSVARPFFQGVDVRVRQLRNYPFGELTSHVVGYVGRINEEEMKVLPVEEYRGSTFIGKLGIEHSYETELHGKTGYSEIEVNVQGRPLKTLNEVDPVAGANLHLSLDIELQKTAFDALEKYNGAVVAIEIATGGVLTFVSKPGFDPNPFVVGIGAAAYKELQKSQDQPLYNRALRGLYPPGSTIKPFMALAGLENNVVNTRTLLSCPGFYQLPNDSHHYRDWRKGGHGPVNVSEAVTQSCDVYFYRLASMLGIDRMHSFLSQFGFGKRTGIDLTDEKAGLLPSREWKLRRRNQAWFPGETVISGIGQGYNLVTPLQLSRATATLANNGKIVVPRLVERVDPPSLTREVRNPGATTVALQPNNLKTVIDAMINVVHSARGTAQRISGGINYHIAGKTGTAQVINIKQNASYNESQIAFKQRDHALFISFAPAENPKIAVAVIAENGGHGGAVAAPIAAKVIKQYLTGANP
ncbi:MAG: penicillin-binding protein 2 [Gammaproteobacteria bacterium]|nr:penicillin-binding protein 2 [Gammaproteobacteria bacterium]